MRSRSSLTAVLIVALLAALWVPPLAAATRQKTQAQLRILHQRIEVMARQESRDARARAQLAGELRAAELALGQARGQFDQTGRELADQGARRAALAAARGAQERALTATRAQIAGELRAAYLMSREGPLKLLLNAASPLANARLLSYYGYFGRAGADRARALQGEAQRLEALDGELAHQQATLAQLRQAQSAQLALLQQAQQRRQQVLVSLTERTRTRAQQLAQLKGQQAGLERLLRQLNRPRAPAAGALPPDTSSAFARLRGRLAWPVSGHVQAQFGQRRIAGVSWNGMLIGTRLDTPVHAVAAGRVVYADWLPGLGLLVIIDHGDGYLSLYGHNDRLFKAAGATVAAGDVIAAAGDSGGGAEPQLYFEIRRDGRPVDPRPWFGAASPAP